MHRFFVPPETLLGERLPIPTAIAHQVHRVLRLRDGERIALLGADGVEVICRIEGVELAVEERRAAPGEPRHRLTICQALIKGSGLEQVVQLGTEIGVAAFHLVVTERCVVRRLSDHRLQRLRTIAREAAEQSERGMVPEVVVPRPLSSVLTENAVMLFERHGGARLSDMPPAQVVIIGPEGGFAPAEVDAARAAGTAIAGLGPRILRSDTVAAAVAAVVLSRAGEFA